MKRFIFWGLLLIVSFMLIMGGCDQPAAPGDVPDKTFNIGIVQLVEHTALDDARMGTIQALADEGFVEGQNLNIDFKNAQGEPATAVIISQGFVADNLDLIIAITTPAVQAAATATQDIPIVFNSVTEPQEAGVVESWERPNTNVTGVSDLNPVKETLELILEIQPGAKNVGIIYNTGEVNSVVQADIAKSLASDMGINIIEATVTHTGEVGTAAEALVGKVDAIFLPTDNTSMTAFHSILRVTEENNILVVGSATEFAELGAVAAIGFNYYDLGYQSGIMAAQVLKGANPAEMPVQLPTKVFYAINEAAAQRIGITLPQALVDRAEIKY